MPKKAGFTVVKNGKKELVQTRLPTKIHVCIDYRKLNSATYKYHFSLPFIDQILERLAGHAYYCSWMNILGITKSRLPLKIKKKPHSPIHLGHLYTVRYHLDCATPQQRFNVACLACSQT